MSKISHSNSFFSVIDKRRSIRILNNSPEITVDMIKELLQKAQRCPSAFNMQSSRILILMDLAHQEFWDLVLAELGKTVPAEKLKSTATRFNSFQSGAGTILFFEDHQIVEKLKDQFKSYAQHFENWSQQNNAILQYNIWLSFTSEGLAASLQHYNPIIDDSVQNKWKIPDSWRLIAQMPFGHAGETPEVPDLISFDSFARFETK